MERRATVLDRFGPPEVMRVERQPMPDPGPGEVLVAVDAIGVNFADTMVRRGEYRRGQPLSFTPGFEVAGRVVACGPGAGLEYGTPVAGFMENGGGYADHVVAPARRVYPVSAAVAPESVAGVFLQGVTAWYSVHRYGRVRPREWVLVHAGSGGLGGLAIQLAKLAGARVVATASTGEKLRVAAGHGADRTVSSDPDGLAGRLREATDGRGCDVVVDGVGGPVFGPSLDALATGGRYVAAGSASQEPAMLDARRLIPRAQEVSGFVVARVAEQDPGEPGATLQRLCELLGEGRLRLSLAELRLEQAPEAHALIEGRRHTGKIVLTTGVERA